MDLNFIGSRSKMAKKRGRKKNPPIWTQENSIQKFSHGIPVVGILSSVYLYAVESWPLIDPNFLFGGIIPLMIVISVIYLLVYSWSDRKGLTNNVRANKMLAPIVFFCTLILFYFKFKVPFFNLDVMFSGALGSSLTFLGLYLYSNEYFQPDLDVHGKRPGMTHFPLGRNISRLQFGQSLKFFFKPITIFWHNLWEPYARALTHRGVGHWPIVGVWIRVAYLYLLVYLFALALSFIGISSSWLDPLFNWMNSFYPWSERFGSHYFMVLCLPVYLSDFVHILVDYIDSMKKGLPFCPRRIPRGFIVKFFEEIRSSRK